MEQERHSHHSHRRHHASRHHGRGHKSSGRPVSQEPRGAFRERAKGQGCLAVGLLLLVCAGVLLALLMLFDPGFKDWVDHLTRAEDLPIH